MTSYRLRPEGAKHNPALRLGEHYRFLEAMHPEGYVYVELDGKPRCVWAADSKHLEGASPSVMARATP